MLLLIVAPLMLGTIADPVRLVGFNADQFMLLLIVAPPMMTSIVDPLGLTGINSIRRCSRMLILSVMREAESLARAMSGHSSPTRDWRRGLESVATGIVERSKYSVSPT